MFLPTESSSDDDEGAHSQSRYRSSNDDQSRYRSSSNDDDLEEESFLPKEARGSTSSSISSFSDKESTQQKPKRRPKAKTKTSGSKTKIKKNKTSGSKKKTQQTVSDDSVSLRSVLGDQSKKNLQSRRVSYSQETTKMAATRKKANKKTDDDGVSQVPAKKKRKARTEVEDEEPEQPEPAKKKKKARTEEIEDDDEETEPKDDLDLINELEDKCESKDTEIKELKVKIVDYKTAIKQKVLVIEQLTARNVVLTTRNEVLERYKTEEKVGVPLNKSIMHMVAKASGSFVWKKWKFIATEDELDVVMEDVMMSTVETAEILEGLSDVEKKSMLRSYSLTYGRKICDTINAKRSTTQTEICTEVMKRHAADKRVPTVTNMLSIIRRKALITRALSSKERNQRTRKRPRWPRTRRKWTRTVSASTGVRTG